MKNANLPFDRLMALNKVEGLRYPHSSSLRRSSIYASLLGISGALHLDVFDQPAQYACFRALLESWSVTSLHPLEKFCWGVGVFSGVTGGRSSAFHGVTEWGTRWPRAVARGTARGEAVPAESRASWRSGRASPVRNSLK